MGQKVNPIGLRIGIIKDWNSTWYAEGPKYVKWLHDDIKIRKCLNTYLSKAAISSILIKRFDEKTIYITIKTGRAGVVLGQEGKNLKKIDLMLHKILKDRKVKIKISVQEVKNPFLNAKLVADSIALAITNRSPFRIAQKIAIRKTLYAGARGIKTLVSGRLGGVEMARSEGYLEGTVPLSTLREDIDYAVSEATTSYGQIGVKVWIARGEILPGKQKHKQRELTESYRNLKHKNPKINNRSDWQNKNVSSKFIKGGK